MQQLSCKKFEIMRLFQTLSFSLFLTAETKLTGDQKKNAFQIQLSDFIKYWEYHRFGEDEDGNVRTGLIELVRGRNQN